VKTRTLHAVATAIAIAALLGCATGIGGDAPHATEAPASAERSAESVQLLPIEAWPRDVSLRQRVEIHWGEDDAQSARFEAVLEKRDGTLMLVGLGPMSRPGFVIRATDDGLDVTNRMGRELPFDPAHILADVQRVFYPWDREVTDVVIEETFEADRLVERRFRRSSGEPSGTIRVAFEPGWYAALGVPRSARVENGWFGYTIVVETFEANLLEDGASTER